jgi:hypothetical protein
MDKDDEFPNESFFAELKKRSILDTSPERLAEMERLLKSINWSAPLPPSGNWWFAAPTPLERGPNDIVVKPSQGEPGAA